MRRFITLFALCSILTGGLAVVAAQGVLSQTESQTEEEEVGAPQGGCATPEASPASPLELTPPASPIQALLQTPVASPDGSPVACATPDNPTAGS